MFYVSGNLAVFQPFKVLFAAITRICCNISRCLFKAFNVLFNMGDQRTCIIGILMDAVGGNVLIVSA